MFTFTLCWILVFIEFTPVTRATDGAVIADIAPRDAVVGVGNVVVIKCKTNATQDYEQVEYSILHNQKIIEESSKTTADYTKGSFSVIEYRVNHVNESHGGQYTCIIKERSTPAEWNASTTLRIVNVDKRPMFAEKGGSITLRCLTPNTNSSNLEFQWQNNGIPVYQQAKNEFVIDNVDVSTTASCTVASQLAIDHYGNMSTAVAAKAAVTNNKDIITYNIRKYVSSISITIQPWTPDMHIEWSTNNNSTLNDSITPYHDGNTLTSRVNVTADVFPVYIHVYKEGRMVWNYMVEPDADQGNGNQSNLGVVIGVSVACAGVAIVFGILIIWWVCCKNRSREDPAGIPLQNTSTLKEEPECENGNLLPTDKIAVEETP